MKSSILIAVKRTIDNNKIVILELSMEDTYYGNASLMIMFKQKLMLLNIQVWQL